MLQYLMWYYNTVIVGVLRYKVDFNMIDDEAMLEYDDIDLDDYI